jgi:hypothetical protein
VAKYVVSVVLPEKRFLTFGEAANYVDTILAQSPDAVIEVANDKQ